MSITIYPDRHTRITIPLQKGVMQYYYDFTQEEEDVFLYMLETGTSLQEFLRVCNMTHKKLDFVYEPGNILIIRKTLVYRLWKIINKYMNKYHK